MSDLTRPVEWRALLKGVETVVHLAGIAHAGPGIAEEAYDRVNRLATAELASAARAIGIRHLVFISSIRAQSGPSSADDPARDRSAASDRRLWPLQARRRGRRARRRRAVHDPAAGADLRPGVKGNLARLIELARKPWPLPLGLCRNRRSLLARENLIGAIHFALAAARRAKAKPTSWPIRSR